MSTQQVERLQALLQRVKGNRDAPRAARSNNSGGDAAPALRGGAPVNASPVAAAKPAPAPAPAPAAAAPRPAAAPAPQAPAPQAKKPAPQGPTTPVGMPTPARVAAPPVAAMADELDFSSLPPPGASRAPAQEPAFTPAERRTRPGATPLEMAVEDTLDRPAVSPVVAQPARAQPAPAPQAPAPAPPAAQAAPAAKRDGVVLADPVPANPARPIAQVLSKQAPITPTSFGDLLKRSLSLRPR
jgi:hypothetical protein